MKKLLARLQLKKLLTKENLIFFVLFLFLLTSAFHEQYPDEYDNLIGGKFILHGLLPYRDYMAHHGPIAYFVAGFLQIISGFSLVKFRVVYTAFLALLLRFAYIKIVKKFGHATHVIWFTVIAGLSLMYFWLHMLIADAFAGFLLVLPYLYLLMHDVEDKKLEKKDVVLVNLYLFATLFTSVSYLYFIGGAYVYLAYLWLRDNPLRNWRHHVGLVGKMLIPYIILAFYLVVTGSAKDYYFQNVVYNRDYYIYNYPKNPDGQPVNPIRYGVYLAKTTLDSALPAAVHALRFNIYEQKTISIIGLNLAVIMYFFVIGRPTAGLFVTAMILLGNTRETNIILAETDYQHGVYILLSLAGGVYMVADALRRKVGSESMVRGGVALLGLYYLTIFVGTMLQPYTNRVYAKYMGTLSLIYDRPEMAPTINRLLTPNDYAWIGPFYPEEMYYVHTQMPSKYFWLLPANAKSDKIKTEMMADFATHRPSLVVFNSGYGAFGASPEQFNYFMMDYLHSNYTLMRDTRSPAGKKYDCTVQVNRNFDCNSFLYIRNDLVPSMLDKMLSLGMAKEQ